ncbi:hypothetical protein MTR_6g081745 [Medicago truncatula]|uniref:Uncharacterized protein n=1 Tax=Medicago truncatula TaxID=3880 RepID=A0A072UB20_MEDTR|nr:hypothetical protein MTR_6g081745 [Medicago truncatula]
MALLSYAKRGLPFCMSNAVAKTKAAEDTKRSILPYSFLSLSPSLAVTPSTPFPSPLQFPMLEVRL